MPDAEEQPEKKKSEARHQMIRNGAFTVIIHPSDRRCDDCRTEGTKGERQGSR